MKNKEAEDMLAASVRWFTGALNAIEFTETLQKADDAAAALERGARCLKRAADLMDQAAKSIKDKGL